MRAICSSQRAFSLIELVIVVIIIGIIAAIAVPRMSSAADNASLKSVVGSQSALQKAVDLYTVEHEGVLPHIGAADAKTFYFRLLRTSDLDGSINESTGIYGPYINGIPVNSINGKNTIRRGGAVAGAGTHGWRYDTTSGQIEPDHPSGETGFKGTVDSVEKMTDELIKSVGG
ncbi:MAG: prepilin-type N-terminal cleavage/methylation domain-containing protein [Phycisphaerales bacterium]|nr:prepilin-type N-terminal cleavage/methylation domain-containing protein [Phycisphaerales bacterium]